MEAEAHKSTGSYGSGTLNRESRAQAPVLLSEGRFDDAVQKGIDHVYKLFPGKYDDAVLQMIDDLPR